MATRFSHGSLEIKISEAKLSSKTLGGSPRYDPGGSAPSKTFKRTRTSGPVGPGPAGVLPPILVGRELGLVAGGSFPCRLHRHRPTGGLSTDYRCTCASMCGSLRFGFPSLPRWWTFLQVVVKFTPER